MFSLPPPRHISTLPKAAVAIRSPDVGLSSDSGGIADIPQPPLRANCGLMHSSKKRLYSITSSARASSIGVMVSLVESAKERLEEIRYDAAAARLDFRGHGHLELENMRVASPP
jgi:hypothetical protein